MLAREKKDEKKKGKGKGSSKETTKSDLVDEIEQNYKIASNAVSDANDMIKEDFRFALGDQWTDEEREILEDQGRPCLTFNKIEPLINLVGGYQRENSFRIKAFPEGGEDKIFSEIADKILGFIDKTSKLSYKLDHEFDDGIIGGKGWIEMAISYDRDIINGELMFRQLTPYQVLKDPEGREYDQSDWGYMIKVSRYSRARLKSMYPDKETEIEDFETDDYADMDETPTKESDADNYHNKKGMGVSGQKAGVEDDETPKSQRQFTLIEYYHRKFTDRFFVYNVNIGMLEKFDKKEEADARRTAIIKEYNEKFAAEVEGHDAASTLAPLAAAVNPAGTAATPPNLPAPVKDNIEAKIKVIKRSIPEMWYAAIACGVELQGDIISPLEPYYSGYPFFHYFANWNPSAETEELRIKGITRNIKDPNREVNKSRSQYLHILNTSANSGWIGDRNALRKDEWEELNKFGSKPGIVIKKKEGSTLERIHPVEGSMANITRGEAAEQDIKEISGINSDALAIQDKTTSGRAISLRIKTAITILAKYFRNFRYTKEMVGDAIFAMVPDVFDIPKIKKILGEKYIKDNQISDGVLQAFLRQVADRKYNIDITEADNSATIRLETFEQLADLAKGGYPIPPDVILEFSAIPNSAEIISRIKAYQEELRASEAGGPTKTGKPSQPAA